MRRLALLCPLLLLGGCGFGHFLNDSFTLPGSDPNAPYGTSENMLRVRAQQVAVMPLLTEPGNVWPGPPPPEPTLGDIERQQNQQPTNTAVPALPDHRQPLPTGGLAAPGQSEPSFLPPGALSVPGRAPAQPGASAAPQAAAPVNGFRQQPGSGNIVIPNGNGTSTVIGPNGSVSTIPTPH